MIKYTVEVHANGTKIWHLNGKFHREDGPAVEGDDGTKKWYLNGELHREEKPAIEYATGDKSWYLNGKLHREDGPAVEHIDGRKRWYLNGKSITEQEHKKATTKATCDGKEVEIDGVTYILKEKQNG